MKHILALAALVGFALSVQAAETPDILIADLKKMMQDKKVTLIDVNGTAVWQKGHIPGAIDFGTNKSKLAKVLPEDKNALIVAYCGGPG